MPLRLLLPALDLAGWACIAGGAVLAVAAFLVPAGGLPAWLVAAGGFGAGMVGGLALIGFAANLRLIATLVSRTGPVAPPRGRASGASSQTC